MMLAVAAAAMLSLSVSVCVAGLLDNEGDCEVVVTSCERTQGCSQAVVRTPPVGCERCVALIRLFRLLLTLGVKLPGGAV